MRGGVGGEYETSLSTGSSVLKNLSQDKYDVFDVLVTKDKEWHIDGFPTTPAKLTRQVDVIFNALHGEYGEDGKVQRELGQFGIPYTGSTVFSSAIAMNKALAKYYFKQVGIKTPECAVVRGSDNIEVSARRVFRKIPGRYIIKPILSGSSVGVSVVSGFDKLLDAIKKARLGVSGAVIIEEYIEGREISCGVVDSLSGGAPHAIYPVEVILPAGALFFDYERKQY